MIVLENQLINLMVVKRETGSGPEFVGAKRVIPELNKGRSGAKRTVIVQRQVVEKVVPVPVYQ